MRLDQYLFDSHKAQSRQKAQELIALGCVYVDGKQIFKNSFRIDEDCVVEITTERKQWVARSGEKLWGFLLMQDIKVDGKEVLDIGSSTGGFSEVLLERGAQKIVCVDVGSDQLHPKLRNHPKITVFENQDIRTFDHHPFELIVCDVSFISLDLILKKIYELALGECILLFKPQFELGRLAKRNKKGVILNQKEVLERIEEFVGFAQKLGFELKAIQKSHLRGKCGNEEYFIYLSK
ncbi:23S rRNA (cytidine-2'-O)-methyltransferase TlyA [Helicobacter pametensis]|uniref:23S rRNA (cytidine-2'-O)-methyltransferase TlyA n=1 Tax=Helicobacter pametensis TaxID=95149 RepID=UPI0004818B7C|nr:TlyA family RNA methyltransferase [Helicobacter pametensis]